MPSKKTMELIGVKRGSRILPNVEFADKYDTKVLTSQVMNSMTGIAQALAGYARQTAGGRSLSAIRNLDMLNNNTRMQFVTSQPVLLAQLFSQFAEVRRYIQQPNRDAMRGSLGSDIQVKLYVATEKDSGREITEEPVPEQKRTYIDKALSYLTFGLYGQARNSADEPKDSKKPSEQEQFRQQAYDDFKAAQEANKKLAEETGRMSATRGLRRLSAYEERLVLDKMEEEADLETVKIALDWKDLFGGAGIIVGTIGAPDSYLNIHKIQQGDPLKFYTANNWQLAGIDIMNLNVEQVNVEFTSAVPYHYGDLTLHESRVLALKGDPLPYPFAGYARGWGMSRLEPVVASMNKRIKSDNVSYEMLDEAKVDVLRINGFDDTRIDPVGEELITKKGELIAFMKNYLNMIMLDSNDEYTSKQMSFSGLAEIMNQARIDLTAAFGMPETKVWGFQATGFNSGGSDIASYHEKIESEYRPYIKRILKWMIKLRARQVLGKDVVVDVQLPSLDSASPLDQAKINSLMLDTVAKFSPSGNGILTSQQVYEILNDLHLFPVDFDTRQEIVPNPQMGNMFVRGIA